MALSEYKKKRKLDKTPEPRGGESSDNELRFVVQKHHASRLHYDFRLEMKGTLKSWAVPKGPSLNPEEKRLAVEVEDHPYDYKDFEGIIPKGNYGAGKVIVWDEGTYEPLEIRGSKKAMEKDLLSQWKEGSLKFRLKGKKLKGEFSLVRMKDDKSWLLIKHKDRHSSEKDITEKDRSVVSGKTLEEIGEPEEKDSEEDTRPSLDEVLDKIGDESAFPDFISPMLATPAKESFDHPDWLFEIKWDGYRAMAHLNSGSISLKSRNNNSFNQRFYTIFKALQNWNINAVIDGEIVAIDDKGMPSFNRLQNWKTEEDGTLAFYVFDLLWLNDRNLMAQPLSARKSMLKQLIPEDQEIIRSGFEVRTTGVDFFSALKELGLEGMVAKRADSIYVPGERSSDWLKIKTRKRQEVVIGGYTKNTETSEPMGALLVGVYEDGRLRYSGRVGTGFRGDEKSRLIRHFQPLVTSASPFENQPGPSRWRRPSAESHVIWVKPVLVCEIYFSELTQEGIFRHSVYIGLREDKEAKNVSNEMETASEDFSGKTRNFQAGNKKLRLTNLDKVLWPDEGYTKGDMLRYYHEISKYIIPYLKDRPQSLNRFPDGIMGESFYQKDVTGKVPDWVEKFPYKAEGENKQKHYMLCNDEAALLYMANLGAIEMNPWNSKIQNPDNPTWAVLDLDPDKGNSFEQVIQVAQAIRRFLENIEVPSYCKTSGSTGLHVYVPLEEKYTYDHAQLFAKWVATEVNEEFDFTSVERTKDKRKGLVYIDFLQNRPAATVAAPYSLRPKPDATVSMPVHWDEVKKGLKISDFTIENALERVQSEGDIFKQVLGEGVDLKQVLANISREE